MSELPCPVPALLGQVPDSGSPEPTPIPAATSTGSPAPEMPTPLTPFELVSATDIAAVVRAAVANAKAGDMEAARVVWRFARWRCLPMVIEIGEVRTAEQIAEAQAKVLGLVFAGRLAPVDGACVSAMIENRRKALHTLEQQDQLDELLALAREQQAAKRTGGR